MCKYIIYFPTMYGYCIYIQVPFKAGLSVYWYILLLNAIFLKFYRNSDRIDYFHGNLGFDNLILRKSGWEPPPTLPLYISHMVVLIIVFSLLRDKDHCYQIFQKDRSDKFSGICEKRNIVFLDWEQDIPLNTITKILKFWSCIKNYYYHLSIVIFFSFRIPNSWFTMKFNTFLPFLVDEEFITSSKYSSIPRISYK
jgi:hypothetical protein